MENMKKRSIVELLILRAMYNKELHDAIENGDKAFVEKWIRGYDNEDRMFYDVNKPFTMSGLQQELKRSDAEINAIIRSGRTIMGM